MNTRDIIKSLDMSKPHVRQGDRATIYFLRSGKFVKIGRTRNLERRMDELLRSHDIPFRNDVELLGQFNGSCWDETRLHSAFEDLRFNGEWFRHGAPIRELIELVGKMPVAHPKRAAERTVQTNLKISPSAKLRLLQLSSAAGESMTRYIEKAIELRATTEVKA